MRISTIVAGGLLLSSFPGALVFAQATAAPINFRKDVAPILEKNCVMCHGSARALAGLRLHTRAAALAGTRGGPAIVPGSASKSPLFRTMSLPTGTPMAMPPGGQLPAEMRQTIERWIDAGAEWPAEITLGPPPAKMKDDQALTTKLAARIPAADKAAKPAAMQPYTTTIPNTLVKFSMVPVPGGKFQMGTPETEKGRTPDEGPVRTISVEPFWMGKFEVTWNEYRLFMFQDLSGETLGADKLLDAISRPTKPYVEMSFGMGTDGFPAISMTQHAANKYAQWLSAKTGQFYRLPTEAEWEYACRAGTSTAFGFGNDPKQLGDYAWFADNSDSKYQQVGKKKPNAFGLYDMHGNVAEWVLDQYDEKAYAQPLPAGGFVPSKTPYPHVARGGGWSDDAARARCGTRLASDPSWKMQDPQLPKSIWYLTDAQFQGFRLVRPLKVPSVLEMHRYWNNGVERE